MNATKKRPYPTLHEMGVESPKQIDRYYITSINRVDVLRVVYDRPEDSFLPSTRTYKFPRIQKTDPADGTEGKKGTIMSSHPKLRLALAELETIMKAKSTKENIAAEILNEIELLEEDIAVRSECLKVLAKKIPAVD